MGCEVKYCCCCVSLRHGTLMLGYFRLFGGVLFFIMASVGLSIYNSSQLRNEILCMAQAIYMISSALLIIVGVYQKKPAAIRAYCWMSIIVLFWEIISFIVFSQILLELIATMIPIIILGGLDIYFFFVFRSTYLAMQREQQPSKNGYGYITSYCTEQRTINLERASENLQNPENPPGTSTFCNMPEHLLINMNN